MMMNKKFLTMAAAAMMFAACSNEMDPVSSPDVAQNNAEVSAQTPVLFDAYSGRALTRAGAVDALDNTALATYGFGVFGYYTENELYNDTYQPTFMYNARVSTTSWTYSPLKYWPNEFGGAAQSDDVDRLSFFAYAPYVHVNPSTGIPDGASDDKATGIIAMTRNSSTGDPFVKYAVNFADLTKQVDFSWGVAKEGAPTAVTGATQANIAAGSPFKDLVKPTVNEKIGFEFNHALAQLNVKVDAQVDGATDIDGDHSRIWVRSVTFEGFATKGMFNLNQSKVGAVWSDLTGNSISADPVTVFDGRSNGKEGVSQASNEAPAALNAGIVQAGAYTVAADKITAPTATGVTKTAQNLFGGDAAASLYVIPNQQDFKVTIVYDVETVDPKLPTYLADGVTKGSRVQNTITKNVTFGATELKQLEAGKKYTLTLHLGMSTVKFDAAVTAWDNTTTAEEVMLPINQVTMSVLKTELNNVAAGTSDLTIDQLKEMYLGKFVHADGAINTSNTGAVGTIVYLATADDEIDTNTELSAARILVMATKDAPITIAGTEYTSFPWLNLGTAANSNINATDYPQFYRDYKKVDSVPTANPTNTITDWTTGGSSITTSTNELAGYDISKAYFDLPNKDKFYAIYAAYNYDLSAEDATLTAGYGLSGVTTGAVGHWFLPTAKQMIKLMGAANYRYSDTTTGDKSTAKEPFYSLSGYYWSSSEYNATSAWRYGASNGCWNGVNMLKRINEVRPIFAY